MGIWKWVQEKASSISNSAPVRVALSTLEVAGYILSGDAAVDLTRHIMDATSDAFSSQSYRKTLSTWLLEVRGGATRMLDVQAAQALAGPNTQRVWMLGEATALVRLIPIVAYYGGGRPVITTIASCVSSPATTELVAETIDIIASYYFVLQMIEGVVDNIACNWAMSKASCDESVSEAPAADNPLVTACPEGDLAHFFAGISSTLYYYGNSLGLYALASTHAYGEYTTLLLQALLIGWSFMENPLGSAGNCSLHREAVKTANKVPAIGMGLAYIGVNKLLQWVLFRFLSTSGVFSDAVIAQMVTLHFIMMANLTRNTPLPGKEPGVDPFFLSRGMTDLAVARTAKFIENRFDGNKDTDWYADMENNASGKWNSRPIKWLRYLLLTKGVESKHAIIMRPTVRMYLELGGAGVEKGVQSVIEMRASNMYATVDYFKNVLPNVKAFERKVLTIVRDPYLERPLNSVINYIRVIRDPKYGIKDEKDGLYRAARRKKEEPPKVEVVDETLAPVAPVAPSITVQGLYGAARKRFVKTVAAPVPLQTEKSARPPQPNFSPSQLVSK